MRIDSSTIYKDLFSRRFLILILLVIAISVFPRIHIGYLKYGKLLDIRFEDILIFLLAPLWLLSIKGNPGRLRHLPLSNAIYAYLIVGLCSTLIGLFNGWIDPVRAAFFYAKELEYFFLFFITVDFVDSIRGIRIVLFTTCIAGLMNGLYVLYQVLIKEAGGYLPPGVAYTYYGASMLGEAGPGSMGNYFSLIFFIVFAVFLFTKNKTIKIISLFILGLSLLGLILSICRTSIIGFLLIVLFFSILFIIKNRKMRVSKNMLIVSIVFLAVTLFIWLSIPYLNEEMPMIKRITSPAIFDYWHSRVESVYLDYFKLISIHPIIGMGKSITGQQDLPNMKLPNLYMEAHNHYMRVVAETGLIGLVIFIIMVISIIRLSLRIAKYDNPEAKIVGKACVVYTFFLLITALGLDVFVVARPIGIYWILVGLVVASERLRQKQPV